MINAGNYVVNKGHRHSFTIEEAMEGITKKKQRLLLRQLEKKKKHEFELLYQMERQKLIENEENAYQNPNQKPDAEKRLRQLEKDIETDFIKNEISPLIPSPEKKSAESNLNTSEEQDEVSDLHFSDFNEDTAKIPFPFDGSTIIKSPENSQIRFQSPGRYEH